MLPDFPEQKAKISALLSTRLDTKISEYLGYFGSSPRHAHHEGRGWHLTRSDGSVDDANYQSSDAVITVEIKDVPDLTLEQLLQKIDRAAEEMAGQVGKATVEKIMSVTEDVGNVIDAQGERFNKQSMLEMIDKIALDFEDGGEPKIDMLINPETWENVKDRFHAIGQDSEYQREYKRLMEKKRGEWHARESSRKLVD